jgi:hypothetical protein
MQVMKHTLHKLHYSLNSLLVLTTLFAMMALSSNVGAQVLYGSLTGDVTDSSNAVVPGAKVAALEINKGVRQEAITDGRGIYQFTEMLPGTWKITVTAIGFTSVVTENIHVDANSVTRVNAQLSVATANETVTVTGAPPLLQTDRADVHTVLSAEEVESLPSISTAGKNFQELLRIIPGATLPQENNSASANPTRGMTSNVNGQSSQGNNTRIDGVSDLHPYLPNNVAYVPPSTAIGEVNISTNSMDAEQGMVNGAAINVTMKSGTNQFHGEAHEFHTDDGMKNKNYFTVPNLKKPLNVFNQYGASLGGPIIKDKLFFFADWEGSRQSQQASTSTQTVPYGGLNYATAKAAGYFDFSGFGVLDANGKPAHIYDPSTGNAAGVGRTAFLLDRIPLSRVDPAALTMASLIPAATTQAAAGTLVSNNYLETLKGTFARDNYDAKINYVPSEKTNYFGHFSMNRSLFFDPPALGPAGGNATDGGQQGNSTPRVYVVGLGATHAFTPNLLLDVNAGYTRLHLKSTNVDIGTPFGLDTLKIPGTNDAGLGETNQLYWGQPAFTFNTFAPLGNTAASNPFEFRDNQILGNANLTWVKGRHQFRVGFEDDHTGINHFQPQGTATPRGSFGFTGVSTELPTDLPKTTQIQSYADFLLGLPFTTGKTIQVEDPNSLRWSQFGMYVRDQFQVSPTLTLTYGVRYEIYPMAYSDHGKGTRVLNLATMNVLIGGYGTTPVNAGVQTGHGFILPRLGLAWRPDSKTVVRGGFGLSADSNNWRFMRNDYPVVVNSSNTGLTSFAPAASLTGLNGASAGSGPYTGLFTGISLAALPNFSSGSIPLPANVATTTIPLNFRRGYTYGYNLAVEREAAGFVVAATYVGSITTRPLSLANANYGTILGGGNAGRILNLANGGTNYADIAEEMPIGRSYYNSLQAKVTRKIGHSSTVGVIETWSKIIDYGDNEEAGGAFLWNGPTFFWKNKGLAGYNRASNTQAYWIYDLPFGKGQKWANGRIGNIIVGGWQFSGVLSLLSGMPSTVTDSSYSATLNDPDQQAVPNQTAPVVKSKGNPCSSSCTSASPTWFSTASFTHISTTLPPSMGNVNRNTLVGPGYFDLDGTLKRNFKIRERLTFQIEGTAIGLTNSPHFANPDTNWSDGTFGQITSTVGGGNAGANFGGTGGERLLYVGGKLIF